MFDCIAWPMPALLPPLLSLSLSLIYSPFVAIKLSRFQVFTYVSGSDSVLVVDSLIPPTLCSINSHTYLHTPIDLFSSHLAGDHVVD